MQALIASAILRSEVVPIYAPLLVPFSKPRATIKAKHPELSDWDPAFLKDRSFKYNRNFEYVPRTKGKVAPVGPDVKGCFIHVWVQHEMGARAAEYRFRNLSVWVHARVTVGEKGNQARQKEIRSIVKKRLERLAKTNRQYRVEQKK